MTRLYPLMLFVHVGADIGIFIGLGVELFGLAALRRAQTAEQARTLLQLIRLAEPVTVVSALLTLAAGFYMALTVWSLRTGWIAAALASLVFILAPLIVGVIEPRMRAIMAQAREAAPGPLPSALRARLHDPLLGAALQTAAAVVFGLVFLMTTKPALAESSLGMAAFVGLGLVSSTPLWIAARRDAPVPDRRVE